MSPSKAAVEAAEEIKGVAANYTHHWPQALTGSIARIVDRHARSADVVRRAALSAFSRGYQKGHEHTVEGTFLDDPRHANAEEHHGEDVDELLATLSEQ